MASENHASAAAEDGVFSDNGDDFRGSDSFSEPPPPRRVSRTRQFSAVLRKNWLLQIRASKAWYTFGAAGWTALLIEILVPGIFFALLCIPKFYLNPMHFPQQLAAPADLDATSWALHYQGPAHAHEFRARLLYAPNDTAGSALMRAFAKSVACPLDPAKRTPPASVVTHASFFALFRQTLPSPECDVQATCLQSDACFNHLAGSQIVGYANVAEALERASSQPSTVDAIIDLQTSDGDWKHAGYTLRLNHTEVPSTRGRLNDLSSRPDQQYRKYWLFANLQHHLDRALLGMAANAEEAKPALLELAFKPFPWPAGTLDAGAAVAAAAFNLLLVFAFLVPTKGIVAALVREKELRLREGMRILGLQDGAYWGSWALTHGAVLGAMMLVCAVVSLYPFRHSSFTLLLAVLWLVAAALIAFAYFLSTLFSKSRVAGMVAPLAYSLAMLPGYLMPTFQPYGGFGWYFACLFPPSAISLFANLLLEVEAAGAGLHWGSLGRAVTAGPSFPFSARVVLLMLLLDILLYSMLFYYLDKARLAAMLAEPRTHVCCCTRICPLGPGLLGRWSAMAAPRTLPGEKKWGGAEGLQVVPSEVGANLPWDFPFRRRTEPPAQTADGLQSPRWPGDEGVPVAIRDLRKTFHTAGAVKTAVDNLSLDVHSGEILALLGPNGAGKTTTISVLTGMLAPSGGDALIGGRSIRSHMADIRQNLGVCPQFDILWPEISVREHLQLYAALKGYAGTATDAAAKAAAAEVGLGEKLDSAAGDLSGGQRRKLSVAICFLGNPAVVILDEPTSGMDPYTRRFTWQVIRRHRREHATILTTHSMEEADALADKIAIMTGGRLAASGTSLSLKHRFGVGYRLTLVRDQPPQDAEGEETVDSKLAALIQRHVPGAQLVDSGPAEAVFRLPKEHSSRLPAMLRQLDRGGGPLGLQSYGLSETTLEEVFLEVTQRGKEAAPASFPPEPQLALSVRSTAAGEEAPFLGDLPPEDSAEFTGDFRRPRRLKGAALYGQQLWALLTKRAVSASRDRLALWTQLAAPLLLVVAALAARQATSGLPQEPLLSLDRASCEFGAPTVLAASAGARANGSAFSAFGAGYPAGAVVPTSADKLWQGPPLAPVAGTLDGVLLDRWGAGRPSYEAVFAQSWNNHPQILGGDQAVRLTLLANQSAPHALPTALNAASSALLRALTGDGAATISIANHPLPTLVNEAAVQLSRATGDLLLVLLTLTAAALLSAGFAVFIVRERESRSKVVQLVSGAPPTAFWLSTLIWDICVFSITATGILLAFIIAGVPQFQGPRLGALAALLWAFGAASLLLTYVLHFAFEDEMKAMQRINSLGLLFGFVGFMATFIMDLVAQLTQKAGARHVAKGLRVTLMAVSPHYNLAQGMYKVASTHLEEPFRPDPSPWSWKTAGQWLFCLAVQAVAFSALVLLIEGGGASLTRRLWQRIHARHAAEAAELQEDEDVQRERYRIQDGRGEREGDQVVLAAVEKSYPQGFRVPPVHAVAKVSFGIPPGQCFGLLGVNGAGKTTAFRILTGEVVPDAGDAKICSHSVLNQLAAARQNLGYCPQASALPGALTGREVLRLYARLRGVPSGLLEPSIDSILRRLDLADNADNVCESYSGGMKRKLSVAIALVGEPPVVMLDEPSTGMDPGAKRFLWDILRRQVIDRGHTVLLTSHSMEECEALCGRLAIMAAGQLRCIGSPQHLKARFGAGYVLDLRLGAGREIGPVTAAVQELVSGAELTQASETSAAYSLPREGLDLATLFERMDAARERLGIEEFSVSQATLEHVFVRLAQQ